MTIIGSVTSKIGNEMEQSYEPKKTAINDAWEAVRHASLLHLQVSE